MKLLRIVIFLTCLNLNFTGISLAQTIYCKTGMASYYAHKFHGKTTASGEKYDMNALTAAHNSLPFNTFVKVTNLQNNKSVGTGLLIFQKLLQKKLI
jgi:rare lipoprotein A (peptidoglycan hydrolase)